MFSEVEKVKIRGYLGASSFYLDDSSLEDAIVAVQSIADGGIKADSSTENYIKAALTVLETIDAAISNLIIQAQVSKAGSDSIEINPARGLFVLRSMGRAEIGKIASTLGHKPLDDYYCPRNK